MEGKIEDMKFMLTRRFGQLPDWAVECLEKATLGQLDSWLVGIFDARSVDDLLGSPPCEH